MNSLVPALRESIFNPTYEIAAEFVEIGIDAVLESDALKGIPIVNSIAALCKVGYNLHERNLIKQTLSFILGYNAGTISRECIEAHQIELTDNPRKAEKELGRVLIILDKHVEVIQSQVMGSFYGAYSRGDVTWEKFCELSEANRRMFLSDYHILIEAAMNEGLNIEDRELYQVDRLISLGLLQNSNRLGGSVVIDLDNPGEEGKDIIVTSFGKTFCEYLPAITFSEL